MYFPLYKFARRHIFVGTGTLRQLLVPRVPTQCHTGAAEPGGPGGPRPTHFSENHFYGVCLGPPTFTKTILKLL